MSDIQTVVLPPIQKKPDRFESYERSDVWHNIPTSTVVFGPRRSGKSTLFNSMLDPSPDNPLRMEHKYSRYFDTNNDSEKINYDAFGLNNFSTVDSGAHELWILDDPPVENTRFKNKTSHLFRTFRHKGISPFLAIHDMSQFSHKEYAGVRGNMDNFITTMSGMTQLVGQKTLSKRVLGEDVYEKMVDLYSAFKGNDEYSHDYIMAHPNSGRVLHLKSEMIR